MFGLPPPPPPKLTGVTKVYSLEEELKRVQLKPVEYKVIKEPVKAAHNLGTNLAFMLEARRNLLYKDDEEINDLESDYDEDNFTDEFD